MVKRIVGSIFAVGVLVSWLWFGVGLVNSLFRETTDVLGRFEYVRLRTPTGDFDVVATIDTGADFSSIDEQFALSLGLTPTGETKRIITEAGTVERDTVRFRFILGSREISSLATLANRSAFSNRMLVGKADLEGFTVNPSREFLTQPGAPTRYFFNPGDFLGGNRLGQVIIMVPILAGVVVLLRLIIGVRTYGVFAPTIIAITLLDLGILPGVLVYLFLVIAGIGTKMLVLDQLRLPRVAEFALVMSVLVAILAGITQFPGGFVSFAEVFFPLIITTHLIEQASRGIEEHNLSEAIAQLLSTVVVALLLAALGQVFVQLTVTGLWIIFGVTMVATIAAGNYLGLRFSELIRFKFLRRTHVHK